MASDTSPDFRIASISSMIVELADIVSFQEGNIRRSTYQSTLFPEPATKRKTIGLCENVSANTRLPWIQRRELGGGGDFHSENVLP